MSMVMAGTHFDVAVVIRLTPDSVKRAFRALASIGSFPRVPITAEDFSAPEQRRRLIEEKEMKVLNFWSDLHRETPLDVFVSEPFDFGFIPEVCAFRDAR